MKEETIRLTSGHSLIMGHVTDLANFESNPTDIASLGLFNTSAPNHVGYSPGVSSEDFTPQEADFIYPVFRMLSAGLVWNYGTPIDFSKGNTLRNSMGLLKNQVVYPNHEMLIENALGVVTDPFWEEGYKSGNVAVPAGINSKLKIDAKANPRIARALLSDPPLIHSSSVSVTFSWEKSHKKMTDDDFYKNLGTFDSDGKLVAKQVNNITRYYELSLVPHGADPFAKQVKEGKVVNPHMTTRNSSSLFFWIDYTKDVQVNQFSDNHINYNDMSKTHELLMAILLAKGLPTDLLETPIEDQAQLQGLLDQAFPAPEPTPENFQSIIEQRPDLTLEALQALENNQVQETDATELAQFRALGSIAEVTQLQGLGKNYVTNLRELALRNYKLTLGKDGQVNPAIETLIAEASEAVLKALNEGYETQLEATAPLSCDDCGSLKVSRKSSVSQKSTEGDEDEDAEEKIRRKSRASAKKFHA
jgi:hypothetical protein